MSKKTQWIILNLNKKTYIDIDDILDIIPTNNLYQVVFQDGTLIMCPIDEIQYKQYLKYKERKNKNAKK